MDVVTCSVYISVSNHRKEEMVLEDMLAPSTVLERTVGDAGSEKKRELRLLFLGCEAKPPYGPYKHTATLFLDLVDRALQEIASKITYCVIIDVYHISQNQFPPPTAYGDYDGIILPGSFNAAYDSEPWILDLAKIIQLELVPKQRPTLGVCFGHQIFAHSFPEGAAIKCPAGLQAGRKATKLTSVGQQWLNNNSNTEETSGSGLHLFYTHGDMVEQLPPQGKNLSGILQSNSASVISTATENVSSTFRDVITCCSR